MIDDARGREGRLRDSADYRRLSLTLGVALIVLIGTAIYLLVRDRLDTRDSARGTTRNISIASQVSISGLLAQSTASLQAIRADMQQSEPDRVATMFLLGDAMRFDPLSAYLGYRRAADGSVIAVDARGGAVPAAVAEALKVALPPAKGAELEVSQLIQLPGDSTWYMPLTLEIGHGDGLPNSARSSNGTVFALVDGTRLVAGVKDVYPAADAFVAVLGTDGQRLIKYLRGTESFQFNGRPIRPDSVAIISKSDTGNFETVSSLDGVRSVFGFAHSPTLPIVVVTGVPTSTLEAKWIRQSVAPTVLLLLGVVGILVFGFRLRGALRKQWAYLAKQEYLANHDTLTGLRNRDSFMRLLTYEIKQSPQRSFGIVLMDLNNFKDVNDTLGHAAGDQLLCELGQRLVEYLAKEEASVARLGGDEIGVFVRRKNVAELPGFATELQACIAKRVCIAGVELEPAASMGGAVFPQDAESPSELMRCADIAMYAAKASGVPFTRYSERMDSFSPDRLAMKAELAAAIRDGLLHLVYQPKVRLADGLVVGCEALARWVDRERGAIPPSTFIPMIERSELIHAFTEYVLRMALEQVNRWRASGHDVPVAVNISANNLHDDRFIERVTELLSSSGVPASALEFEVTESAVMRNPEATVERLHELRKLGVKLSIDDFGTGHASLAYLKHLPVHTLKIDKAFVSDIGSDVADRRIVLSSISLAHGFGMTVVSEGVETEEAVRVLREYDCDYAQGYHFSKPLPAAEFEAMWLDRSTQIAIAATEI